jgi:uncharacterized membrane protein
MGIMEITKQLLGRLHPLVVHLPIGFIILGLLLQLKDRKEGQFRGLIALVFLWGGYAAVLACVTGYLQYLGEGYAFDTVKWHLWAGLATALWSFLMWARMKRASLFSFFSKVPLAPMSVLFFVLLSFTGHQGGNITHGEDYLVEPLPNALKAALGYPVLEKKEITLTEEDWQSTALYTEVVQPILDNNCVSCHNPKKTKGGLLLHTAEALMGQGDSGPAIVPSNAEESELLLRMQLPKSHEKHMPPDGKAQPTKEEVALIGHWIQHGAPLQGTIGELGLEKALFQSFFTKVTRKDHPDMEMAQAPKDSVQKIKQLGLHAEPLSKATHFLKVSALNLPSFSDADMEHLSCIGPQLAVLDLGGTQITDAAFQSLAGLPNLTILKLDHTQVTGKNMALLQPLKHLRSINLAQTAFAEENLAPLEQFPALENIYLYNPNWEKTGSRSLGPSKVTVEYGNYLLPAMESDSIVY